MLLLLLQIPSVLLLFFNISCSLSNVVLTATLAKLKIITKPLDATVVFPELLQPRYQYPRTTDLAWTIVGVLLSSTVLATLRRWFPDTLYLHHPYASSLFSIVGIYCALVRLDCWRLFVADFLREVWRLKEFAIIDQVMAECCSEKRKQLDQNAAQGNGTLRERKNKTSDRDHRLQVLDFGGGKGKTTEHMLDHCTASVQNVEAIDIEEYSPHVKKYDGEIIPYPPHSFDIAVAMYVFHHIPDTPPLIQQLRKTCKRVLIFEDLPDDTAMPLVSKITFGAHFLLFNQSVHTVHAHHTQQEWHILFEEWGMKLLKEIDIPPTTALPYKRIAFLLDVGED